MLSGPKVELEVIVFNLVVAKLFHEFLLIEQLWFGVSEFFKPVDFHLRHVYSLIRAEVVVQIGHIQFVEIDFMLA